MSRLIDADAFERKVMCGYEEDVQDVIYSLRDFPTAYDIDKVVEQLERVSVEEPLTANGVKVGTVKVLPLKNAIEIVKGGGKEC